ncbi:hypothetical protein [Streptomyces sp. NBC_01264]|nr:hypothetical protein [Streptomyces sp. NBC_01264]MCX4781701.1 hypothetical protein [Streptomyces sp. NBC_01264]
MPAGAPSTRPAAGGLPAGDPHRIAVDTAYDFVIESYGVGPAAVAALAG